MFGKRSAKPIAVKRREPEKLSRFLISVMDIIGIQDDGLIMLKNGYFAEGTYSAFFNHHPTVDLMASDFIAFDVSGMLKVTSDGRKVSLDQRVLDPLLPDDPASKVNLCVQKVFDIWNETAEDRLTQVIFCDQATPGGDKEFKMSLKWA